MAATKSKRADLLRLREILHIIIKPFEDPDMDFLTTEDKLIYAMRPSEFPIYRRKILSTMRVKGLWWMNESQWVNFMWNGYADATLVKSGQDPDRVLVTKSFEPHGYCYIREMGDRVDIEAISVTSMWDKEKKKNRGSVKQWLTVSITMEEYQKLVDNHLGPIDDRI